MKYSINSIITALCFTHAAAFSADMLLFNNSALTVMQYGNLIQGHYLGRSMKAYMAAGLKAPIICEFLFMQKSHTTGMIEISAFENTIFMPDERYITDGIIHIHEGVWKIVLENVPKGCASKEDGDQLTIKPSPCCDPANFIERGGLYVEPIQHIHAVGFRILDKHQALIKTDASTSLRGRQKVGRGSVVAVLKFTTDEAYVRFVVPRTGEVVQGWMSRDALIDPFSHQKRDSKVHRSQPDGRFRQVQ